MLALARLAFVISVSHFANGQSASRSGGFKSLPEADLAEGGKVHRLASFALDKLLTESCQGSTLPGCSELYGSEFVRVLSAGRQTVSGIIFEIRASTTKGEVTMRVYEQSWTDTLTLTEATFMAAGEQLPLITETQPLDAGRFGESDHGCTGGQVWNQCGSPCTKTCSNLQPMCAMMCKERCQCPRMRPVLQDGQCIAASYCPAPASLQPVLACIKNTSPRCTREFRPVCADGVTYSNRCLAAAMCPAAVADGACPLVVPRSDHRPEPKPSADTPGSLFSGMLLGGAPMGDSEVSGGHFTGQDQATLANSGSVSGKDAPEKDTEEATEPTKGCPGCPIELTGTDIGKGSKTDRLAGFALQTLLTETCVASNAMGCAMMQGATMTGVLSASTQVVAGQIHSVRVETSVGILKLRLFEQSWTNTLMLSEASIAPINQAEPIDLLTAEVALNAAAFELYGLDTRPEAAELPPTQFTDVVSPTMDLGGVASNEKTDLEVHAANSAAGAAEVVFGLVMLGALAAIAALVTVRAYRNRAELVSLTTEAQSDAREEEKGKQQFDSVTTSTTL